MRQISKCSSPNFAPFSSNDPVKNLGLFSEVILCRLFNYLGVWDILKQTKLFSRIMAGIRGIEKCTKIRKSRNRILWVILGFILYFWVNESDSVCLYGARNYRRIWSAQCRLKCIKNIVLQRPSIRNCKDQSPTPPRTILRHKFSDFRCIRLTEASQQYLFQVLHLMRLSFAELFLRF